MQFMKYLVAESGAGRMEVLELNFQAPKFGFRVKNSSVQEKLTIISAVTAEPRK